MIKSNHLAFLPGHALNVFKALMDGGEVRAQAGHARTQLAYATGPLHKNRLLLNALVEVLDCCSSRHPRRRVKQV